VQILRAHGAECPLLRPRRLRHRRVDELRVLVEAEDRLAAGEACPIVVAAHGGGVAHAYRWPAETEVAVVVLLEPDLAVLWGGRVRACGVTAGGAAVAATKIEAVRAIYDGRYTRAEAKARGFHALIAEAELVRTRVHLTGA
jgi:hypothetical protein